MALLRKTTWRQQQPASEQGPVTSASRHPRPCAVPSHTVPRLICVTSRTRQKLWCATFDIQLIKDTVASVSITLAFSLGSLAGGKVSFREWAVLQQDTLGKALMPYTKSPRREIGNLEQALGWLQLQDPLRWNYPTKPLPYSWALEIRW